MVVLGLAVRNSNKVGSSNRNSTNKSKSQRRIRVKVSVKVTVLKCKGKSNRISKEYAHGNSSRVRVECQLRTSEILYLCFQ